VAAARHDDAPDPDRKTAAHAARSRLADAEAAERRAATALVEAQERVARLAPHVATLTKLDAARAAIVAKDAAFTGLALDLHRRVAAEVRELRHLIEKAGALYTSLPVAVRTRDLNLPQTAAAAWGAADPDSVRLLTFLSDALLRAFPSERVTTDKARV
jgi:hypothetical protein